MLTQEFFARGRGFFKGSDGISAVAPGKIVRA